MRFTIVDEAATRELRRSVLRPHLSAGDPLPGDHLPDGVHLGAVDEDGTVLCTCFVYPTACPWLPERPGAWRLRSMATVPSHRGQGLGGGVVDAAVDLAASRGGALLWCNAREPAVAFYARHGFVPHGPLFVEHGLPHQQMHRELSAPATSSR